MNARAKSSDKSSASPSAPTKPPSVSDTLNTCATSGRLIYTRQLIRYVPGRPHKCCNLPAVA